MEKNFKHGITTLAVKISTAIPYEPVFQKSTIPSIIVLSFPRPNRLVNITGDRFAGM
jgi:hypothetical protein